MEVREIEPVVIEIAIQIEREAAIETERETEVETGTDVIETVVAVVHMRGIVEGEDQDQEKDAVEII